MSVAYSGMPYATRGLGYGLGGMACSPLATGFPGVGYGTMSPGLSLGPYAGSGGYGGYNPGMLPGYGYGMTAGYPGDLMTSSYMARGGSYMAPVF